MSKLKNIAMLAATFACPFLFGGENTQGKDGNAAHLPEKPPVEKSEGILDSLEITAYRFGMDSLSVPVNSHVLEREEIENSASATIPEVLAKRGNVRFMSYSGGYSDGNLAMRGFGEQSQTRILVLVDGVRYNPADMAAINWSTIPIGTVESIEILRGAQSAMYGGNAEAGVVKISTVRPSDGYDFFADALYGSYGLYNVSATASGREDDAFYSATVSTYNYDGYREYSNAWSNYANVMAGYDFSENSSIILKGDYGDSYIQYPSALGWEDFQNNPQKALGSTMAFHDKTGLYTANINAEGAKAKADAALGIRFRDRKIYDNGATLPKHNNQWTYSFSPRFETTSREDTSIFGGIDANYSNIDYWKLSRVAGRNIVFSDTVADVNRIDLGAYAGASHNLREDFILSGGVRADSAYTAAKWTNYVWGGRFNPQVIVDGHYDDSEWNMGFSGDLGATYKLCKTSSLYARFDQIFHYPTTDEIAYYQSSSAKPFNTGLDPEHGQNYEIGYKFQNEKWSASLNGFATYLQNEISWDDTQKLNVNLSPTIRYGVDFGASYDDEYWGASIFGTFVRAKFDGGKWDGNDVPLVAPFNGSAQVYVKPLEFVTCIARATYFSSSVMGNDYANTERSIPSYYTIDFQVNVAFTKYFTIFGALENATNENYAAFAYKAGSGGAFYPNAGRTFKIGINIKL